MDNFLLKQQQKDERRWRGDERGESFTEQRLEESVIKKR